MAKKIVKKQTGGAVAGVKTDYKGTKSYLSRNPAPAFKKGGAKKKMC